MVAVEQTSRFSARRRTARAELQGRYTAPGGYLPLLTLMTVLATTGCRQEERLPRAEKERQQNGPELALTAMQQQGLRHFASVAKNRQASAAALAKVKKAMEAYLFDPGSATYSSIKLGQDGSVCGKYNAKNRYGAYVGYKDFVLTGDNRVFVSDSNGGVEASSDVAYIGAYLQSCATKAQIAAYNEADRDIDADMNLVLDSEGEEIFEQEPDRILDAPTESRPRPEPTEVPTA